MHCPTCQQVTQWAGNTFRPFCSERCRLVDLEGWMNERYRIPQDDHESSNQGLSSTGSTSSAPQNDPRDQ